MTMTIAPKYLKHNLRRPFENCEFTLLLYRITRICNTMKVHLSIWLLCQIWTWATRRMPLVDKMLVVWEWWYENSWWSWWTD